MALVGFGVGWKRHRSLAPMLLSVSGAAALLYPLHEALDVSVMRLLVWLGFGLLLVATAGDTWLAFRARGWELPRSRSAVPQ